MAQTLQTLSIISFAVAGVCFALATFLWFFFKIPTVIGDLSGTTARKSIAKTRAANEKSGVKTYKASKTNAERGKLTETITNLNRAKNKVAEQKPQKPETGLLAENLAKGIDSVQTALLETETTGLLSEENATQPLMPPSQNSTKRTGGKKLTIIEEILLIHTDEVIEENGNQ